MRNTFSSFALETSIKIRGFALRQDNRYRTEFLPAHAEDDTVACSLPMAEFPSTVQILDQWTRQKPHTKEGQWKVAELLVELVEKFSLGVAKIHPYVDITKPGKEEYPNVVMDIPPNSHEASFDEQLLLSGHIDTIPPDNYPEHFERDPNVVTFGSNNPRRAFVKGGYDMLGGVLAYLLATRSLKEQHLQTRRHTRIVLTTGEEDRSQGTFAALEQGLFDGSSYIATTEIPVGGKVGVPSPFYIGRPGRVGFRLTTRGPAVHSGNVTPELVEETAINRFVEAFRKMKELRFPEHPHDPLQIMQKALVQSPSDIASKRTKALTVNGAVMYDFHAFYCDPHQTAADIQLLIQQKIEEVLSPDVFTLKREERGGLEFIGPYLSDHTHPFVKTARALAQTFRETQIPFTAGRGVADEGIIKNALDIPCVGWSPTGGGEHEPDECVSIPSIERRAEWLLKLMTYPDSLVS